MMKKRLFTIMAIALAIVFWNFDSLIHHFLYDEPDFEIIPSDFNELWMRTLIVLLLVLFGLYMDNATSKRLVEEKRLAATDTYNAMMNAVHHILNNLLNQMQLFRMEAERCEGFDRDKLGLFNSALDEAKDLVDRLSEVNNITRENIRDSVRPSTQEQVEKKPD